MARAIDVFAEIENIQSRIRQGDVGKWVVKNRDRFEEGESPIVKYWDYEGLDRAFDLIGVWLSLMYGQGYSDSLYGKCGWAVRHNSFSHLELSEMSYLWDRLAKYYDGEIQFFIRSEKEEVYQILECVKEKLGPREAFVWPKGSLFYKSLD